MVVCCLAFGRAVLYLFIFLNVLLHPAGCSKTFRNERVEMSFAYAGRRNERVEMSFAYAGRLGYPEYP